MPPRPRRLLVLACSATKRDTPGPAIHLYDGPLWRTLRAADPDGRLAQVAVLSARYGFRDARFWDLAPYDTKLTREAAAAMVAGGTGTRWPRPPRRRDPDNYGTQAAGEAASMTRYGREPFEAACLVGGHLYLDVMRAFLREFAADGYLAPNAVVTEVNGAIGFMRRDMRAWLAPGEDGAVRNPP